ncbi:ABC transporter ATP-binding protein [Halomarina pelagica]|uniref:ABC transporter ATP-binding protein n=1 Tax=Halomarina pelagica TaxID=2961599 RepID=UPI0020C24D55|nr:ABC transporter ATP-binding protein [Halomarina sp. BND7]
MALLNVSGLTKRFGDLTAVDDATFEVEDGEFVSILGPSGSGKSTILRMIAGFEEPTAGSIDLAGEELVGTPPFERDLNMVFQNLALFPHLTVAENVQYGLKQKGVSPAERESRTEEMLAMVRLDGYGPRTPDELSGGEQQRVALARALVNEPALILFDEPLSSLDRKLRQHMQSELQRIQSETGITFLYVTHDQEVALSVSDRLVVLDDGVVEQIGSVEALYETPNSQFVADFIGDVNTVPATVSAVADDRVTLATDGGDVSVARTVADGVSAGDAVNVCVRPHHVRLGNGASGAFVTPGVVRNRSYRGSDVVYTVDTDAWGPLTADVRGGDFEVGEAVTLAWDERDVHLFAAEGGA